MGLKGFFKDIGHGVEAVGGAIAEGAAEQQAQEQAAFLARQQELAELHPDWTPDEIALAMQPPVEIQPRIIVEPIDHVEHPPQPEVVHEAPHPAPGRVPMGPRR